MKSKSLVVIAAMCCSMSALAEEVPQAEPMVVTANRSPIALGATFQHTTIISAEDIRQSGAADLVTLLRREAGFESSQTGGVGQQSSTFMRGTNSKHNLVLIDGVRVSSSTIGATALDQIMLSEIDHVEIVRGNVSSLYGSDAIGGVIQIFTKEGIGTPALSIGAGYGSENTSRLNAQYAGQLGQTSFSANLSSYQTDGFSSVNARYIPTTSPFGDIFVLADGDDDAYRNISFSGALSHEIATGHELGLKVFHSDAHVEFDGTFNNSSKPKLSSWSIFSSNRWSESWNSKFTVSQGIDDAKYFLDGKFTGRIKTNNDQLNVQNEFSFSKTQKIVAGLEYLRQRLVSSDNYAGTGRTVNAGYASYYGELGAHSLQVNGRFENYSDFGAQTTGLLGYAFAITPQWKVNVVASNAFHAPTFDDLYSPFGGNPNVKAEKAKSTEVGMQYKSAGQLMKVVYFETRITNLIDFVLVDPVLGTFLPTNVGRSKINGVELSYSGKLGPLAVRASFTHQRPINQDTDQRLQRRARNYGSVTLTQPLGPVDLTLGMRASGNRSDITANDFSPTITPGYAVADFSAQYRLSADTTLSARLDNVLDKKYELQDGYNTQRRAIFVSVNHRF